MIANITGFLLSLSLLVFVLYSLLTNSFWSNLPIIASIFLLLIVIEFVVGRIFRKNRFVAELREGIKAFGKLVNSIVVSSALFFVYFFGVGFAWLISRLIGKKFMKINQPVKTTWEKKSKKIDYTEMF